MFPNEWEIWTTTQRNSAMHAVAAFLFQNMHMYERANIKRIY